MINTPEEQEQENIHPPTDDEHVDTQDLQLSPPKLTPTTKGILAGIAVVIYCLIAFTLTEMSHPLGWVMIGIMVLGYIVWFVRMPKEQRMKILNAVKDAEQREAQSPFRKALKVIGVSLVIVIVLIILIELSGKYF